MPPLEPRLWLSSEKCQNHTPLACAVAVISRPRSGADSVTGFDDACLVAELVGEPVADEHFDVRRHSLCVRSPLRRQRHLLRLRERLRFVIHLISPCP